MRIVVTLFLCLPLLVPPGVCACGARPASRTAPKCECCKAARKACPAKPARIADEPRSTDDHAPSCPAHPTAGMRLVKHVTPVQPVDTLAPVCPVASTTPSPAYISRLPTPVGDSHSDPPIYLHALRC